MMELFNYIGGKCLGAKDRISVTAPATGQVVASIPRSQEDQTQHAIKTARKAFRSAEWQETPAERRSFILNQIADRIESDAEEFAQLESLDTGKPISLARRLDVKRAIANFRFFASALQQDFTHCHRMPEAINYTDRSPLGVVGLITPWNLPLYLLTWKMAPALAMGNTLVAKPSELTPLTANRLFAIISDLEEQGIIPPGVCNLVHGYGPESAEVLVRSDDVAAISFTGGTATGTRVSIAAAPSFKKVSLELGGKNPTIIFEDAHLEDAVDGATRAAFLNQGQICLCGSRIFVHESIFNRFVESFVDKVRRMQTGDPQRNDTQIGAVISAAHREKIMGWVEAAKALGGDIVTGGHYPEMSGRCKNGYFIYPTVILGLSPDCPVSQEEIFGPVVTVHTFKSDEEAVALANGVRYGLAASVWTQNLSRAHRVAHQLETGMVWVNTWLMRDLRAPFGGVKQSGIGREGGFRSFDFFSEAKNICVRI